MGWDGEWLDFEALESGLRRQLMQLAARIVERQLNQDGSHTATHWKCCCIYGYWHNPEKEAVTAVTRLSSLEHRVVVFEW